MKHTIFRIAFISTVLVSMLALSTFAFSQTNDNQNQKQAAEQAADSWLKLVDGDNYAKSWSEASSTFKAAVSQSDWEQKARSVRAPLGALVLRQLHSADYTTTLPGAPDGEYVVIRYDSKFAQKKSAIETVACTLDKDGQWRVSGYFIK